MKDLFNQIKRSFSWKGAAAGAIGGFTASFIIGNLPDSVSLFVCGVILGMPLGGCICAVYWIRKGFLRNDR